MQGTNQNMLTLRNGFPQLRANTVETASHRHKSKMLTATETYKPLIYLARTDMLEIVTGGKKVKSAYKTLWETEMMPTLAQAVRGYEEFVKYLNNYLFLKQRADAEHEIKNHMPSSVSQN
ncbi:hypothetical protein EVAR_92299_1 [Eumeta japonica]|uniref:Uncharacterized protein n=1 Tax=Eumeta variegata TaxID=151549 RepID=A0A4C1TNL3_EUMVA|nr:hypothetical protein EVAR_92299_1 [Eumeta japonica]